MLQSARLTLQSPAAKVRAPEEAVGEGAEGDTSEADLRVATAQTLQGPGKRMESGFRRPWKR